MLVLFSCFVYIKDFNKNVTGPAPVCRDTLRITIANYHWALRFLSKVCATEQRTEHELPADVRGELLSWARVASTNAPLPVYTPDVESDFVIYTDASAYGRGAISISRGGNVKTISKRWSTKECEDYNIHSSVVSEPLALRKAIAALVPTTTRNEGNLRPSMVVL
jgi:hypothetical protein